MPGTPEWQRARIRAYYDETTEKSYLANWTKDSLGFHFGLGDETTPSHEAALLNTNVYLAERAGIREGQRVLDAGCGVGGSALWLAKERQVDAVGITLVARQVELARAIARERGLAGRVQFQCMDMVATSFEGGSFDVVWSIESLCHVVDCGEFFREARRLLKRGGRFACIDLCRGDVVDPELERLVCEGWALAPLRTANQVVAAMRAAGFELVETEDLTNRAMRSAHALRAMAQNRLFLLRAEQAFLKTESSALEAHARAALAMVDGLERGATTVSHFLARA